MQFRKSDGESPDNEFIHDDPVVDEALEWFGRLRDAAPDADTLSAFEAWLARDPRHAAEFSDLEAIWGATAFRKAVADLPAGPRVATAGRPTQQRPQLRSTKRTMRLAMAASVAAIIVGAGLFPSLLLRLQADYLTSAGVQSTVKLPDGSTMMLNTGSAVAVDFKDERRQVRLLRGEAYFDVRHDTNRPFRVSGRFGDVEVKGTSFSVQARDSDDQVVLERGRVEVRGAERLSDKVVLSPGQMAVVNALSLSVEKIDPAAELAWRNGRIVFESQPFSKVLRELRRYYPGTVVLMTSRVDALPVTGNYRTENIENALRTLADAAGVTMSILPGGLVLLR